MNFFVDLGKNLKKFFFSWPGLIYLILMILSAAYLLLPPSNVPQIGESYQFESGFISDLMGEPSGTYFTNREKNEVIDFYLDNYHHSTWLNLPLITRAIEYPADYVTDIINDMHTAKNTSFLVEINHPFKESLIIKGYGEVSQADRNTKSPENLRKFTTPDGQEYFLMITVYQVCAEVWEKLALVLILFLIVPLVLGVFYNQVKEAFQALTDILPKKRGKKIKN
jgi:hypothetical protein